MSTEKTTNQDDFRICVISAMDANRGIGYKGTLPWHLPGEGKYYHGMINHLSTPGKQNAVIFGRVTYESIHDPADYAKLLKVVVSRGERLPSDDRNVHFVRSFEEGLEFIKNEMARRNIETVWSLGGAGLYKQSLESPYLHRLYLTQVLAEFPCDTHFPEVDFTKFNKVHDSRVPQDVQHDNGYNYQVTVYERKQ